MEFKRKQRRRPQPSTPLPVDPAEVGTTVKKKLYTVGMIAGIIVVIGVLLTLIIAYSSNSVGGSKPRHQTVLPKDTSIDELGGWKRVSPPEGEPVFAYADKIDGVSVLVSQQPLPGSLSANADSQVASLAKSYNATSKLDVEGTTAYVGTSAKGPQSAILTKKGLLILIKSQKKISDESWIAYIANLD